MLKSQKIDLKMGIKAWNKSSKLCKVGSSFSDRLSDSAMAIFVSPEFDPGNRLLLFQDFQLSQNQLWIKFV